MNKNYAPPSNQIKLTLDFRTMDRLKALAKTRNMDATRCAYELLQEVLGMIEPPPITAPSPADAIPPKDIKFANMQAFKPSIKPEGNA